MGQSVSRCGVSCVLAILVPLSLFAADTSAAMLYTNGSAWVNGAHVPNPTLAIFSGDLLQTRSDSIANINTAGSTITVLADSLVKFEGSSLRIEHGGATVSTARGVSATAGNVRVTPISNVWTEFNVTDVDGTVRIAARKGDLTISDGKETTTLAQGQETTRDEDSGNAKGSKKQKGTQGGANTGASGGLLNNPWAIGVGGAAVGGYVFVRWVLLPNEDAVSPYKP
jgi:hypothetical protein